MIRAFTILFLLLSGLSAFGQNCSSVDLRRTPGGQALGDVRNQGGMPWCASYATADLISFRMRQKISGLGVAIHWTNRPTDWPTQLKRRIEGISPPLDRGGSNPGMANRSLRGRFQCLERDLPSDDNYANSLRGTLEKIAEIKRQYDRTRQCTQPSIGTVQSMFPRLDATDVVNILRVSSLQDVHKLLLLRNCRGRYISLDHTQFTFSRNWADADAQLSRGNMVAFGYNPQILKNASTMAAGIRHASSLMGRRMRNGKCEYLVRNSWGRSCGFYDRSYPCEQGNIWIPGENLKRSAGDFFYNP